MKKTLITVLGIALFAFTGCEDPFTDGKPHDAVLTVTLPGLETRTAVAEDAQTLLWSENDCIGVATATVSNYCFGVDAATVGKTAATFRGNIVGGPQSVYYPYSTSAGADVSKAALSMPAIQSLRSNELDMKYNFMVGVAPEGDFKKGFNVTLQHKMALLEVSVKPNEYLTDAQLKSFRIQVPGRTLAGKFTLDRTDASTPLEFSAASDTLVLSFLDKPALPQDGSVTFSSFLNPGIAAGDSLHIVLKTDKGEAYVDITADEAFAAGGRHLLELDIAALVESKKCRIPADSPIVISAFTEISVPGVYDLSNPDEIREIIAYKEGQDQYALYNSGSYAYYRLLNFSLGYMIYVSTPKTVLSGTAVTLKTENVGLPQIAAVNRSVQCVKVTDKMGWFQDLTDNIGYILLR